MKLLASVLICFAAIATLLSPGTADAQTIRHELIRGDMPPGLAADYSRMGNPRLEGHIQPVRVISPLGSRVDVAADDGGFLQMNSSRVSVGLRVGPVYRFKVSNIPRYFGKELYPSIEILNRLSPPAGLENDFPIEVVISEDDLKQAIEGRLVTKVVYLENPETALPHRHRAEDQPYFDVGGGEDPLRAAEKLGRPMAILRMGSRIPSASDLSHEFNFNAPPATLLPEPNSIRPEPYWQDTEASPLIPGEYIPTQDDIR